MPRKASGLASGVAPPSSSFLLSSQAQCMEGARGNLIYVCGRDTSLSRLPCGLWLAVSENHPEAACWLHSWPVQRP